MTRTDRIQPAAVDSINRQIAEAVELTANKRMREEFASLRVVTTLALWRITPEVLAALASGAAPRESRDWARPVERWHHQLSLSSENWAFARSKAATFEPDEIELRQLSVSAKAKRIKEAIEWVERELKSYPNKYDLPASYDPLLRLLEVPIYRVTALMLFDEPRDDLRLLIVQAPPGNDRLRPGTLLGPTEFLTQLAAQPRPRGII